MVWFCCGPLVDGLLSSGHSHTAGSHRDADARSNLTGGPLHTHTHTRRLAAKGKEKKTDRGDHYSKHARGVCLNPFFNAHLRALTLFMCLLVSGKAKDN